MTRSQTIARRARHMRAATPARLREIGRGCAMMEGADHTRYIAEEMREAADRCLGQWSAAQLDAWMEGLYS